MIAQGYGAEQTGNRDSFFLENTGEVLESKVLGFVGSEDSDCLFFFVFGPKSVIYSVASCLRKSRDRICLFAEMIGIKGFERGYIRVRHSVHCRCNARC